MTQVFKSSDDSIFFYLPLYDKEENLLALYMNKHVHLI